MLEVAAMHDGILMYWSRPNFILKLNNKSLLERNAMEIIINHKGTRMVKDGED